MTNRLDITAPASLTVLAGSAAPSSLGVLPPGGITVTEPNAGGTLSVQVMAGNAGAVLAAASLGGAVVSGAGATLSISGTAAAVDAALASLTLDEPAAAARDVLTIMASGASLTPAQTDIAVSVVPAILPAFVAPPLLVTLKPDALDTLSGLTLSDPEAAGIAAMGLGRSDSLSLTLLVDNGILVLPGFSDGGAIAASGLGTGEVILNFTADQIGALNTLLAGLAFAGPTSGQHLTYALRVAGGVQPLTYGKIFLNVAGTPGGHASLTTGSQSLIIGDDTLAGTLAITNTTSVLGNIDGSGAVYLAPDANLELPGNALFLGGTSLDYGTIAANILTLDGTLLAGGGLSFAGPAYLGAGASLDLTAGLTEDGAESNTYELALSLAAGAVLSGDGTLQAGNFSQSGLIMGPGTILARDGETLVIAAGSITGSTQLEAAGGGVMLLGPIGPLDGIFDTTPVSIDKSVTLAFLGNAGAVPVAGRFADTLGGAGGAFVITGPQDFAGTVTGFGAGDQLIFADLTDLTVYNVTTGSFTVGGLDDLGNTDSYVIQASLASGLTPGAGLDAGGDADVVLRAAVATVVAGVAFVSSAGVSQPLPGLALQVPGNAGQSLSLTLSVRHGVLSDGSIGPGQQITLSAANVTAMNAELAALDYTGTGLADTLTIANAGLLGAQPDFAFIGSVAPGTVNAYAAGVFSAGQWASFGATGGLAVDGLGQTPGAMLINAAAEFADLLVVNGISGTAMLVDANAAAIFDAGAAVVLGGDATFGDSAGAGTLAVLTQIFSSRGNLTLAAAAGGAGSAAEVLGALTLAGALDVAVAGAAVFDLGGSLTANALSLGGAGTFFAYGTAAASLGSVNSAGTLLLDEARPVQAAALQIAGGTLALGGSATLTVAGALTEMAGTLLLGPDAVITAAGASQAGGTMSLAGSLGVAGMFAPDAVVLLGGGTITAGTIETGANAALEGFGIVNAAAVTAAGFILAQGGTLVLGGSVSSAAVIELNTAASLDIAGGFSGNAIVFAGADAELVVNDVARFESGARNLVGSDVIDLVGVAPSLVSYASGMVTAFDAQGDVLSTLSLNVVTGQPAVTIVSDNAGGSLITLGDELPCFARGTGLLTPHGYRPVESLKPGDPLITAGGLRRPVRWIGWRTLDLGPEAARFARPVLIMPGAFGKAMPVRLLRLSPLHGVFAEGVLVPVMHLVNGATIRREPTRAAMTYYHIELDRHDALLAEGLACESYFDSGNRGGLYHETGRRSPARRSFAPVVTSGKQLAVVRHKLHNIALETGYSTTFMPKLRALAGRRDAIPEISQLGGWRAARLTFDAPVREITLLSAVACPADTDPDCEDRRELGVCLAPGTEFTLREGWHRRACGDAGDWSERVARLRLHAAQALVVLNFSAIVRTWVAPRAR